jgi:L-ascorbate metabolism protein UlaG (beta-lactamase superfamily)
MIAGKFMKGMLIIGLFLSCSSKKPMEYKLNPDLGIIREGYRGNAYDGRKFINYENVTLPSFGKVMKWQFSRNPQRKEKKGDVWLPGVRPYQAMFTDGRDKIVWLGHASFLITLGGINILTDPVFNDIPFVKRLPGIPFRMEQVTHIQYILISHGHFDHCDKKTLRAIRKTSPGATIIAGLGMESLIRDLAGAGPVQEAGWYQQVQTGNDQPEIYFMPAFHWYKRSLNDDNKRLWGSYVIRYRGTTIFFMGDSGYNTHFREVARYFPKIDICLLGVGAYKPSYMMKTSHCSPTEAVDAFHDLNGKVMVPMHYGTFDLADEPLGEPLRILNQMNAEGKIRGTFKPLEIGEALYL